MGNVFIIAEAGVNHNGSLQLAMEMVDVAVAAGADAIKFQTFMPEMVISRNAPLAQYQKENMGEGLSMLEMARRLRLSESDHSVLIDACRGLDIMFLSTPFDIPSIDFLVSLGLDTLKIPSGEITNLPYLRHIGSLCKKVILSTGMSTIEEVGAALDVIIGAGTPKGNITLLHCNTQYPTPFEDVNLRAMLALRDKFGLSVGYSDHTLGIEVSVAAVAMGAEVIEKHFTLDRAMEGPDHAASLEPDDLAAMVAAIRNVEVSLGDGIKRASPSETPNIAVARKSIVAARDIKKGEEFTEENITVKRPATGITPMLWDSIIGRNAERDFASDEMIEL